jgi:hypothetical protein
MIVCVTRIDRNLTMPHKMASLSDKFRLSGDYKELLVSKEILVNGLGELAGR